MRPFNRLSGNYWILLRDENLVSGEVLILTFLLTAPESTSVGILQATDQVISDYTGLDIEEIHAAIESLEKRRLIQSFFSDWYFVPMRWEFDCIPTAKNKSGGIPHSTLEHAFRELQNIPKACRGAFHAHFPEFQPTRLSTFNKSLHNVAECNSSQRDRDCHPVDDPNISDSRVIAKLFDSNPDPELNPTDNYGNPIDVP